MATMFVKPKLNAAQRRNLLRLADYLESLPKNYEHFDMNYYAEHHGDCQLDEPGFLPATAPLVFLNNCGAVACAVGHGPAAGIRVQPTELDEELNEVDWDDYASRVFGAHPESGADDDSFWDFAFGPLWTAFDNTHWGAAARIRYVLDCGIPRRWQREAMVRKYARYRIDKREHA